MQTRNRQENHQEMKTRGAATKSEPFLYLNISLGNQRRATRWRVFDSPDGICIRNGPHYIAVRRLGAYPAIFAFQNRGSIVAGYAEPALVETIGSLFEKFGDNLMKYRRLLDSRGYREYLLVGLRTDGKRIAILRDVWCVAPIYYSNFGTRLIASNEFSYVAEIVSEREVRLDGRGIAASLLSLHESERTALQDVQLLTERTLLVKTTEKFQLHRKSSVVVPALSRRIVKQKALNTLGLELEAAMERMMKRIGANANTAYEFSGGLDTAAVIGICSSLSEVPLETYSLRLPGSDGQSQRKKSKLMRKIFRMRNVMTDARRWYPLRSVVESKSFPIRYAEEIYSEMVDIQAGRMQCDGRDVLVTGFGGDELFLLDPREEVGFDGPQELAFRRRITPYSYMTEEIANLLLSGPTRKRAGIVPPVPASVHSAQVARSNIYIRRGIWPVSPLSDPVLVAYCRSLPLRWRSKKRIMREYQKSRGYPPEIYTLGNNENFSRLFTWAMRNRWRTLMRGLFARPILEQIGLVRGVVLREEYEKFLRGTHSVRPFHLFVVAEHEMLLRALAT